jgi:hypothetical protein
MQKVFVAAFYVSDSAPSHAFATAHAYMAYVERLRNTQLILQARPSSAPVLHDLLVGVKLSLFPPQHEGCYRRGQSR